MQILCTEKCIISYELFKCFQSKNFVCRITSVKHVVVSSVVRCVFVLTGRPGSPLAPTSPCQTQRLPLVCVHSTH